MSLLTDEELDNGMQSGVADWVISLRPTGDLNRSMFQGVIEAQQAKTLKAVAEWVDGKKIPPCNSIFGIRAEDLETLREGKMPGEES